MELHELGRRMFGLFVGHTKHEYLEERWDNGDYEALKLLPNNNYIGLSVTQGNEYRKKTWPIEKSQLELPLQSNQEI